MHEKVVIAFSGLCEEEPLRAGELLVTEEKSVAAAPC